jgi:hypothetical protein
MAPRGACRRSENACAEPAEVHVLYDVELNTAYAS